MKNVLKNSNDLLEKSSVYDSTKKNLKTLRTNLDRDLTDFPTFDSILKDYSDYLTEDEKNFIKLLKRKFNDDVKKSREDIGNLRQIMYEIENTIKDTEKQREIVASLQDIYFLEVNKYKEFDGITSLTQHTGLTGTQNVSYFYIVSILAKGDLYNKMIDPQIGGIPKYINYVETNPSFEDVKKYVENGGNEVVVNEIVENKVEWSEVELESYNAIIDSVGMVDKYEKVGKKFIENLRENNLTHLKEIIKYYNECPHGVDVSRLNVRAYVAYCCAENNGEPDLDLWNAIFNKDSRVRDDYPEWNLIRLEYSRIN